MRFALRLILLLGIMMFSSCSMFGPKSNSGIIEGDSPNIKYTTRESAGGRVGGR